MHLEEAKRKYLTHVTSYILSLTFIDFFDMIQNCIITRKLVFIVLHDIISSIRWKVIQKRYERYCHFCRQIHGNTCWQLRGYQGQRTIELSPQTECLFYRVCRLKINRHIRFIHESSECKFVVKMLLLGTFSLYCYLVLPTYTYISLSWTQFVVILARIKSSPIILVVL